MSHLQRSTTQRYERANTDALDSSDDVTGATAYDANAENLPSAAGTEVGRAERVYVKPDPPTRTSTGGGYRIQPNDDDYDDPPKFTMSGGSSTRTGAKENCTWNYLTHILFRRVCDNSYDSYESITKIIIVTIADIEIIFSLGMYWNIFPREHKLNHLYSINDYPKTFPHVAANWCHARTHAHTQPILCSGDPFAESRSGERPAKSGCRDAPW